jgi:hypothetical protein
MMAHDPQDSLDLSAEDMAMLRRLGIGIVAPAPGERMARHRGGVAHAPCAAAGFSAMPPAGSGAAVVVAAALAAAALYLAGGLWMLGVLS